MNVQGVTAPHNTETHSVEILPVGKNGTVSPSKNGDGVNYVFNEIVDTRSFAERYPPSPAVLRQRAQLKVLGATLQGYVDNPSTVPSGLKLTFSPVYGIGNQEQREGCIGCNHKISLAFFKLEREGQKPYIGTKYGVHVLAERGEEEFHFPSGSRGHNNLDGLFAVLGKEVKEATFAQTLHGPHTAKKSLISNE